MPMECYRNGVIAPEFIGPDRLSAVADSPRFPLRITLQMARILPSAAKLNLSKRKLVEAAFIIFIGLCNCVGAAYAQQQGAPGGQAVRQACAADYKAFCSGVQPGGGRIVACLKQNAANLSSGCQKALAADKSAR